MGDGPNNSWTPAFVGREPERARMAALGNRVASGEGASAVLVVGPAGIGKSGLIEQVVHDLEGWQVLRGGCTDAGSEAAPLAPFAAMWRHLAQSHDPNELSALLGPARRPLAALSPSLGPAPGEVAPGALYEATASALGRLSQRAPTVVVIEDVHWADPASLALLAYLGRGLEQERLLLLVTLRDDALDVDPELRRLVGELGRANGVERIDLAPLSPDEARLLVASVGGEALGHIEAEAIAGRSDGYPFHAIELARVGGGELPATLRDALLGRVHRLDLEVVDLLEVASVIGRTVDPRLLEAVVGGAGLDRALRAAVDAHVLVSTGDVLSFVHDLQRDAVRSLVLPHVARALHAKVAAALQADPSLAPDGEHAAALARHLDLAGERVAAMDAHVEAATAARRLGALDVAFEHLRRAAELDGGTTLTGAERVELLQAAVEDGWWSGMRAEAAALQEQVVEWVADDAEAHIAALCRLGELRGYGGLAGGADAIERAHEVLRAAQGSGVEISPVTTAWALGRWATSGRAADPEALLAEARSVADASEDPAARALAHAPTAALRHASGNAAQAVAPWRIALDAALEADNLTIIGAGFHNLTDAHRMLGERDEATALMAEADAWLHQRQVPLLQMPFVRAAIAEDWHTRGRWAEASELLDRLARVPAQGRDLFRILLLRAEMSLVAGRFDAAERDIRRMADVPEPHPGEVAALDGWLPALVGLVRADADRVRDVAATIDVERVAPVACPATLDLVSLWLAVEVDAAVGGAPHDRVAAASAKVESLLEAVAPFTPDPLVEHHRARRVAELSRLEGPDPALWRDLPPAASAHFVVDLLLRLRLGEALVAAGERDQAASELAALRRVAQEVGALWLVERVEVLVRRARLHVDGIELTGGDLGLTPRELDVLGLLAGGRTNRQIGEELFISPKTVSIHVSNVLTKLDVPNRTAAAARARDLGLVGASA